MTPDDPGPGPDLDPGPELHHDRSMRLAVTTALHPTVAERSAAREAAAHHGLRFADRAGEPLASVSNATGAGALLVLSPRRAAIWMRGEVQTWHPGMGELRLRRLLAGEAGSRTRDPFLEAAALRPGDAVLDATLGLAADALVAAGAVGPGGRVVGVEVSPGLAALVSEGLRRHGSAEAARIEVRQGEAGEILSRMPDRSFDVVVFDPMFRHARDASRAFELVRRLADPRPLAAETLARARRVARRAVVVKDGAPGWDLARLGLAPLPSARGAKRLYARIDAE